MQTLMPTIRPTALVPIFGGFTLGSRLWDVAGRIPSLDLQLATRKSLVDATTGAQLVTHTRASSGTYVGSDGVLQTASTDAPRFDHDPTTGESLGLLVEEARTNLLLRSEEFSAWVPGDISIATDTTTAPSGANTADTLTVTAGAANANLYQTVACIASTAYTFSIYIRLGTLSASDFRFAVRDDSNGAFIAINVAPSVTLSTSTWQRIVYTFTTPVGCTLVRPYVYRFASAAGGTFFAWGAQLEAGSFPTSYIPTTTATVTRAADVASITGSNFSFYNQTEGTVFVDVTAKPDGLVLVVDDGSFANRKPQMSIGVASATDSAYVTANSVIATFSQASTSNQRNLIATAYATDNYGFAANGGTPQQDSAGALPISVNTFRIGRFHTGSLPLYGTIKRLTFWPTRLSNTTLQQITQP